MVFKEIDRLVIGEASLSGISYGFYNDKLIAVAIGTKTKTESNAFYRAIVQTYGFPVCQGPDSDCEWKGNLVVLSYKKHGGGARATALFQSIPMVLKKREDDLKKEQKEAQAIAKDF